MALARRVAILLKVYKLDATVTCSVRPRRRQGSVEFGRTGRRRGMQLSRSPLASSVSVFSETRHEDDIVG